MRIILERLVVSANACSFFAALVSYYKNSSGLERAAERELHPQDYSALNRSPILWPLPMSLSIDSYVAQRTPVRTTLRGG